MKATIHSATIAGGIYLTIEPETQADASVLVRLGMNGCADTNRILRVHACQSGISGSISLDFRSDRAHALSGAQTTQIRRAE